MFLDHPVLGVGPGAYKFFYLPYRIELNDVYSERIMGGSGVNFAEVHNDHLQLLAETGIPGYALFVAACVTVALCAKRARDSESEAQRLSSRLALPLVITLVVLALALFPLQIAATRHLLITLSALIVGWSRS
jgi:O-antigen ligase